MFISYLVPLVKWVPIVMFISYFVPTQQIISQIIRFPFHTFQIKYIISISNKSERIDASNNRKKIVD